MTKTFQQPGAARIAMVALLALLLTSFDRRASAAADEVDLSPAPTTAPALSPDQQKTLDAAIDDLGSPDAAARERASEIIWLMGKAAEPALRAAVDGPDLEVARRAKEILRNFHYGILPDTPKELIALLEQYRTGEPQQRRAAIDALSVRGPAGTRILLKLWQDEADEQMRRVLLQTLTMRAQDAAALLMAESDWPMAEQLLRAAASGGADRPVRDLAAFLLLRGKLAEEIKGPEIPAGAGPPARAAQAASRRLAFLHRANADLGAARAAAEASGDAQLVDAILIESGAWRELADRASKRVPSGASAEDLGFAAAYFRLAGDEAGAQPWLDKLIEFGQREPNEHWSAAEALLLSARPEPAIEILRKHKSHRLAIDFLRIRLQFEDALAVLDDARKARPSDLPQIEASAAWLLHFLGRRDEAVKLLDRIAQENRQQPGGGGLAVATALLESAARMHEKDRVTDLLAAALEVAGPNEDLRPLFEAARVGPPDRAAPWWKFFKRRYREGTRITLGRLRVLLAGELPAPELESAARAAEQDAAAMRPDERVALLEAVGETLLAQERFDSGYRVFERLGLSGSPAHVVRLGDLEAERQRFDNAARLYNRAWEMDRTEPLPLYLKGWAMTQLRRAKEGEEMMALAHLLTLGDEGRRHAFAEGLERRKRWEDVRRERDLITRTATFMAWELSDTVRRLGDEHNAKGEYARAAELWQRAFLDNYSISTGFVEETANLAMPGLILRTRALGRIAAGEFPDGLTAARDCLRVNAGDTDALIDCVAALDKAGRKPDADALYAESMKLYRDLCTRYPDSGGLHNQLAWAAAKCRRDLDDALAHAKRAVELDPSDTASIDTLAETHFQRNEIDDAIQQIKRCIELEPKVEHHRKQLARFEAGLPGGNP